MGCWAFLFILRNAILDLAKSHSPSPKYQNFMQILEGAANHKQHLLICFYITSAPI
jgi:hypothetical protein